MAMYAEEEGGCKIRTCMYCWAVNCKGNLLYFEAVRHFHVGIEHNKIKDTDDHDDNNGGHGKPGTRLPRPLSFATHQ